MSTIIMSQCWKLSMSPTQKTVLISLADNANDEGVCWPSIARICERTCLSERAVQKAIQYLVESGVLACHPRKGTSTVFTVTPASYAPPHEMHPVPFAGEGRTTCTPPPHGMHPTPAPRAPRTVIEPPMNHQGTAIKEKRQKATRLPNDWILPSEYLDWTLNTYAAATEADVFGTADRFKDYWIARAGATALKLDWFATWRNWIRNDYERRPQKKTSGPDFDDTSWADDLGAL